ncbi:hypothetical protein [Bdellovibrio sp. HCB-110]|uniref:hypothetical protein n=1 Tax=Bdellovibrio sp. HCB-110 TaxID=3391182 RepID=UPI0039B5A5DD
MKSILATAVIVLCSFQAFAGPEEHIAVQTCYSLKSAPAAATIPQRICLEEISIIKFDTYTPALNIYSYFDPRYFEGMKLTYLARHNEDSFSFKAANVLTDVYESGCGSAEKVTLQINGRVDNDGLGNPEYVDISVKYETLNGTCHSKPQVQTFDYIKE